jgi:ubiquinone/menaquinone biosynthesis C-methylase UbiE/uncharacterized protein YbaR (Trm112 family)
MISPDVRALLACPVCRGRLSDGDGEPVLVCAACDIRYPFRDGIPLLLPAELQSPATEDAAHKAQQIAYSDQEPADDFNVTRPRGTPALYEFLMRDKFRRSVIGLEPLLPGATVLVTCGGPGMDAEFLAETGARVILSDISLGALLQARERFRRHGLDVSLVVADAEALPFQDESVDVVYVHDGLHHLEQPALALREMARVARRAVSVSEPARAFGTKVAVRLGVSEEVEEAGNIVMRLTVDEIVGELRAHDFEPINPHRYAMFYRHWPGRPMRALSRPIVFPVTVAAFRLANRVLGRFGNKLAVQAVRAESESAAGG